MSSAHQGQAFPPESDPFGGPVGPVPFDKFYDHILLLYKPPLRSRTTFIAMRQSLNLLRELGGVETTADISTATIARFIASREHEHPNTTKTHLRKLSAACSIAVGEGWLRVNPFSIRRAWVRGVTPKRPRIHSLDELAAVLTLARAEIDRSGPAERWKCRRLYALLATAAYTGMRKTECLTLRVEDVSIRDGLILLKSRAAYKFKTEDSSQPVPMPAGLIPILRGWLRHVERSEYVFPGVNLAKPWLSGPDGRRPCDALQKLGSRAGLPAKSLTFQSLRHSWATHAEIWGLTAVQIQRVMRHTNTGTQNFYRHPEVNNLRAMVEGVTFDRPTSATPEPSPAAFNPFAGLGQSPAPPPADGVIEYRTIPGFERHRLGSDQTVWTNSRRDGHERPGDPLPPWRELRKSLKQGHGGVTVCLRRNGCNCERTLASLMREVFGVEILKPRD